MILLLHNIYPAGFGSSSSSCLVLVWKSVELLLRCGSHGAAGLVVSDVAVSLSDEQSH